MKEIWKDIIGFEGLYKISNLGRVKNYKEKLLKYCIDTRGYYKLTLCKDKKRYDKTVHRLIAENFIDNPENKPCVNHINSNRLDNRIHNLEWVTYSENNKHAHKFGNAKAVNKKKIQCSNGQIFESSYEASEWLNKHIYKGSKLITSMAKNIRRACTGYSNYKIYGFTWRDID